MEFELVITVILYSLFFTNGLDYRLKNLLQMIQRRNIGHRGSTILGTPRDPEDLPEAEPILPGHSLLRPSMTMLKSAAKFPHRDFGTSAVYGNVDNVGITYGKTNERILYTDFRKSNKNLLAAILQVIRDSRDLRKPMMVIEITPTRVKDEGNRLNRILDIENDAGEILDDSEENYYVNGFRRSKRKSKHRNRDKGYSYSTSSASDSRSSSSDSSDLEKNPGNPFTIHKNKYKQNWLWNTFMDGNHMNLNPLAPKLGNLGASGADLFFGRKWWYFNQDDYKPLG